MHRSKLPEVLGYPTVSVKIELLSNIDKISRRLISLIAASNIPVEEKELLANFFLFILNILDIENAKIKYEKIKPNSASGRGKAIQKK